MPKAIILAGENGDDQLQSITDTRSKELSPVANKPLLFYGLEAIREAGITDVGIVVSPSAREEIRAAVGDGGAWGMQATYIEQAQPLGVAHAVLTAQPFLGDDHFIVHRGDGLVRQHIRPFLEAFLEAGPDALLLVERGPDREQSGPAQLNRGRILRAADKPLNAESDLPPLVGVFMFSPKILQAARQVTPSWRGRLEITDAIDRLAREGGRIETRFVEEWWKYSGCPSDLLEANRIVLDGVASDFGKADVTGSRIEGRVVIHRSATVESTVIRGPAIIGPGAHLADAYVGPYTSIGENVLVEGAEIENSIILSGATIQHLGGRLEASVVGRNAKVHRDFSLPRVLRLRVGENTEVALA